MIAQHIPTFLVLGVIMAAYKLLGIEEMLFQSIITKDLKEEYDYIIVGAGTSGATLASRLSEDKDRDVLLIEAGGDPYDNENVDIPIFADRVRGSEFDWQYETTPQKYACKSHIDQVSHWPSGKGLGGSSNLNYLMYQRGSRHDYDDWANNGATGWGFKDVLPYFIKSEDNHNSEYVRSVFHGFGGRLAVQDVYQSPLSKIMHNSFKELGVKKRDINGRNHFGYSQVQATIRGGVRWGSYRAFLRRATDRPNLHILIHAQALKVTFEGRKATGVMIRHDGETKHVKAAKEIILSSGTVGTAKLLLLSGVGPKAHLSQMKVPIVADVPVGENLQDHVMGDGVEYFTKHLMSVTPARAENFLSSWSYSLFGTGMKSSPRFREMVAYLKTRHQPPHMKYPIIALHFVANVGVYDHEQLNLNEESWKAVHGDPPSKDGFTVFPVLLHPRSKGTIRLKSTDPDEAVLINPNYLKEDVDVKMITEAVLYARRLINTQVMRDWEFSLNNNLMPECAKFGNWTSAYIECSLRHVTLSGYSPVGSCRLGAAGDPTAVVDTQLRVRGTKNLRVADASIIPNSMSGNTYASQIMIAEKAADILREKDTVKAIKDYFKHLISVKHTKVMEDEDDQPSTADLIGAGEKAKPAAAAAAGKAAKKQKK